MKKTVTLVILLLTLFSGCGGGGDNESSVDTTKNTQSSSAVVNDDLGKTDGEYNLWDYMTPAKDATVSFVEKDADKSSTYKTTYSVTDTQVTESYDYATNEKTIYTKKSDRITISFEKDGTPNGSYDLDLTANIGDVITVKESTCKLVKHYDKIDISDKTFTDVIEIRCSDRPGYYQKGVGEIAQTNALSPTGSRSVRILSN